MLSFASAKCCPRAQLAQHCWFLVDRVLPLPLPKTSSCNNFQFSGDEKTPVELKGKDQPSYLERWGPAMSLFACPFWQAAREAQGLWLQNEGSCSSVLSAKNTEWVVPPPTDSSLQPRVMTLEASGGQQHPAKQSRTKLCPIYAGWEKNNNYPQFSESFDVHN